MLNDPDTSLSPMPHTDKITTSHSRPLSGDALLLFKDENKYKEIKTDNNIIK